MRKHVLEISVALCMTCLVALAAAIYWVNLNSQENDRKQVEANSTAIIVGCKNTEELRAVVREIMVTVVAFVKETNPERVPTYQKIIDEKLQPDGCGREK